MRTKEQEEDYGYIVEPDLPPMALSDAFIQEAVGAMPELPERAVLRLSGVVPPQYADILVYQGLLPYFESAKTPDKTFLAKWVCGDVQKCLNYQGARDAEKALPAKELDALLAAISSGRITERAAKEYVKEMVTEAKTLEQVLSKPQSDRKTGGFDALISEILSANLKAVSEFREGKPKALEFLVGEFLKREKSLHPNDVRKALMDRLT